MRWRLALMIVVLGALVVAVGLAARDGRVPLGVRGEWEWLRLPADRRPGLGGWALAVASVAAYAGVVGLGSRALSRAGVRPGREAAWVAILVAAGAASQCGVLSGAAEGYGLEKWAIVLPFKGPSGYYSVAKEQVHDPRRFLADYPGWIKRQDSLHIGTHPPGLLLASDAIRRLVGRDPALMRATLAVAPPSVLRAFRSINMAAESRPSRRLDEVDRAAVVLIGALTWLACAATAAPLYGLARAGLGPRPAWAAAACWPLVPSAILFQPIADTALPLLATTALALAAHAKGPIVAALAGVVLAVGMAFTLAFLAVGLAVGITLATAPGTTLRRRAIMILATGLGFLLPTIAAWAASGADPFAIWRWNLKNHARFYVEYPRSYVSWTFVNVVELAVALGLPAVAWGVVGLVSRRVPRACVATLAVLALLEGSGRNLGEVARLWLPLMPPLLLAVGPGLDRLRAGPRTLAATTFLLGLQAVALQASIQVVYPDWERWLPAH
ncbi:MAG TPA: hypothetical protein VG406_07405 [Isosphaeraceae bacterium]|nr:hypothetical protein [Isosphaeraceae bacterium]